mgnify:CR=1 FL=1
MGFCLVSVGLVVVVNLLHFVFGLLFSVCFRSRSCVCDFLACGCDFLMILVCVCVVVCFVVCAVQSIVVWLCGWVDT